MCLALLLGLFTLAPQPAHAQRYGSGWSAIPCDAQGNILSNPRQDSDGYILNGPQTGTLSNTYPQAMINAALDYPDLYGDYQDAGNPLGADLIGLSPDLVTMIGTPDFPNDRVGTYTPGFASAQNSVDNGKGIYTIDETHGGPSSGPIIGSVTGNMSGQLLSYFKMTWSGPDPAPPYPDHADFLVSTYLYAKAEVVPPPSTTYPGSLSVTATASDGAFNETASASAGDAASSGGVPEIDGHHLVRAAVDAGTGIAEVYVDGTAQWSLTNTVPYQVRDPSVAPGDRGDYTYIGPATADGGSFVQASARQDEREVQITCSTIETSYYKGYDPNSGTNVKLVNQRKPDGSISTDSAVAWDNANGNWINAGSGSSSGVPFNAVASNFSNPSYSWSLTGDGTPDRQTESFLSSGSATVSVKLSFPNPPTPILGKSSILHVAVQDSDGVAALNTFAVKWHFPVESWEKSGSSYELSPIVLPAGNGPQGANGFVHITEPPNEVDYSVPVKITGGLLVAGSAYFAAELSPLVSTFLQTAGYTAGLASAPTGNDLPLQGTADQLAKDVDAQEKIKNMGSANVFMPTTPRMTNTLADAIQQSGDYAGYISGKYGPPSLMFDVKAYQHKWHQDYVGDGYDQHGYAGPASGFVEWTGGYEYVFSWQG